MPTNQSCRWYRYSLRTLMLATTFLCLWAGWQTHLVHTRRRLLDELGSTEVSGFIASFADAGFSRQYREAKAPYSPGTFRRWLGDEPCAAIYVRSLERKAEYENAFPEAWVGRRGDD